MGMDMRSFLETLEEVNMDEVGGLLSEGKEGEQVSDKIREAVKNAKLGNYSWIFKPDKYDLVVLQFDKDGSKANSWGVAFFTEAEERGGEEEEDIFKEDADDVSVKVISAEKGNFLDTVKLCIEIAQNKSLKNANFTKNMVSNLVSKSKKK